MSQFRVHLFIAIFFTAANAIELEKCMGDRMNDGQCKEKIKSAPSFCSKGANGDYDYARAYCCRTCVVELGWVKADSQLPDFENEQAKAWLRPQGPKEDATYPGSDVSLTPWCELMKSSAELKFCSQSHFALKCKKTCNIDIDQEKNI